VRRRDFIAGLSASVALPLTASGQQDMPVVGFLHPESPDRRRVNLAAFHRGLAETGFVEGRNVAIDYRWAQSDNSRLPELAAELVHKQIAVIAAPGSTVAMLAAKAATQTIPIVFMNGSDPVALGVVASLNRPGGNLTGFSLLYVEMVQKRLELLHELVPAANIIALLVNPTNPVNVAETREAEIAARALDMRLLVVNASKKSDIDAAFATLAEQRAGALIVDGDAFFFDQRDQLIQLSARHAVPTIYQFREVTVAGGLISFGTDLVDAWRQVGVYTGRILKGEKPSELPVQQSTKIELVVNLKTAKALGLTIPESIIVRADAVIE
jgi:putative ABC transport system substrate-binding protein